jgi:hypothetical protein
MSDNFNPIIETSVFKSVVRDIYNEHLCSNDKNKKTKCLTILIGENDGDNRNTRVKEVIDYLKEHKIIVKYKIEESVKEFIVTDPNDELLYSEEKDSRRESYGDVSVLNAVCYVSINKFIKFLQELSFLPRFSIRLKKNREIVLNDKYLMRKPNFGSFNSEIFEYLYYHSNKKITMSTLKKNVKVEFKSALRQVVRDLRFTGELKKIFFNNVSEDAIEFNNNVLQRDIDKIGISEKKLQIQLKKLERWKEK